MSAGLHEGPRQNYLRRHEREATDAIRGSSQDKKDFLGRLLRRTADTRNLRLAWDYLASGDGQAPGIDGLRFHDLEDYEVWGLIRTLRKAILAGTYRPAPDRHVSIPKASGRGTRTLSIPGIIDRLVQRAIVQTVQPYLDGILSDRCLGYRPDIDTNDALALAEQLAVSNSLWVWLTEDLKDAFNHVPQRRLLDIIRIYIPDPGMMQLMERVVLTKTGEGIRQGGNLSPLLLNLYLHHLLDKRWQRQHPDMFLLRWADDLLILCRTQEQAQQAYQDLTQLLLPIGMTLKGTAEQAIHNLGNGDPAIWLGYRLLRDGGGLKVGLTEDAWQSLSQNLELCHTKDSSPLRAVETILGWISQMGP
jgi:RNA-directed DNA polymerase